MLRGRHELCWEHDIEKDPKLILFDRRRMYSSNNNNNNNNNKLQLGCHPVAVVNSHATIYMCIYIWSWLLINLALNREGYVRST
jgi:hypothetical protein